jgi:hypothetical protein
MKKNEKPAKVKGNSRWLKRLVMQLGGNETSFYGWPLSWFEPCEYYSDADGVVNQDGSLGNPDHSGYYATFRMRDEKRKKAGWA